jgi:hypothetical protein
LIGRRCKRSNALSRAVLIDQFYCYPVPNEDVLGDGIAQNHSKSPARILNSRIIAFFCQAASGIDRTMQKAMMSVLRDAISSLYGLCKVKQKLLFAGISSVCAPPLPAGRQVFSFFTLPPK